MLPILQILPRMGKIRIGAIDSMVYIRIHNMYAHAQRLSKMGLQST